MKQILDRTTLEIHYIDTHKIKVISNKNKDPIQLNGYVVDSKPRKLSSLGGVPAVSCPEGWWAGIANDNHLKITLVLLEGFNEKVIVVSKPEAQIE